MKKIYFLTASLIFTVAASAIMPYKPILKEGRVWEIADGVPGVYIEPTSEMKVISDTVIDGKSIKKVRRSYQSEYSIDYYIYEKGGAIYQYDHESNKSFKFMDFNMTVGDTCHWKGLQGDGMVVIADDSISVRGNVYRRLKLKKPNRSTGMTWVEGIGFDKFEPLYSIDAPFSVFTWTLSVWDNGECVFTEDDFNAPAITSGVITAEAERPADNRIYDLMGREIHDPQPGTVYIRNGKKYVMSTK